MNSQKDYKCSDIIERWVIYLENNNKDTFFKYSSVSFNIISILMIPIVLLTDYKKCQQIRISLMIILNIYIRLLFPSCYFPARQSTNSIISNPITARIIAFIAEFGLYEIFAEWIGKDFWSIEYKLWLIVSAGEVTSTLGVILQSEKLLFFEDIIWFFHSVYMYYLSNTQLMPSLFFSIFSLYLILFYLPKRFYIMNKRIKSKNNTQCIVGEIPLKEKCWVVPMLLGQSILLPYIYYVIN